MSWPARSQVKGEINQIHSLSIDLRPSHCHQRSNPWAGNVLVLQIHRRRIGTYSNLPDFASATQLPGYTNSRRQQVSD